MAKKNYVLDTSVCLTDANVVYKFDNHDIFIPLKVLEEIDGHKKRQDSVGSNARQFIRTLDALREKANLEKGVRIAKGLGILKVVSYSILKEVIFPPDLDMRHPDHTIIATAKAIQADCENRKTIMVSRDINMRVICDSIGLEAQDYISEKAAASFEEMYNGFTVLSFDDEVIDRFYADEDIMLTEDEVDEVMHSNQYVMMVSNANEKKSALAKFKNHHEPLQNIVHKNLHDWNIDARNKEQAFAIDMLMNPDIKIVSLVGRAGSGKTLLAIAAGLQQTIIF
jgi:PhoH-like ATPase